MITALRYLISPSSTTKMTTMLWLVFVCWVTTCCHATETSLDDMFSCGVQYGDEIFDSRDYVLDAPIRVFGKIFTATEVTPNDRIILLDNGGIETITVKGFTFNSTELTQYEFLFRKTNESSRPEDTEFADRLVHEHFGERCASFRSNQVLILTAISKPLLGSDKLQVAIISDGNMTFVMFQYEVLSFPTDFEVTINSSNMVYITPEAVDLRADFLVSGNTGVQGRLMFRIDLCADCYVLPRDSGICYRDNCICLNGFVGHLCSNATESSCYFSISNLNDYCLDDVYPLPGPCYPSPCLNNGTCTTDGFTFNCSCVEGYTGTNCETDIDDCAPEPCQHGTCVDEVNQYNCTCEAGYTGDDCDDDVDECTSWPCIYGRCTNTPGSFECICPPGYGGQLCAEVFDNICESSPCNNGTCILASVDIYICSCPPGFTGTNCETDIDECMSAPCVRGSCIDNVNDYQCVCEDGFAGKNCHLINGTCEVSTCNNGTCEESEDGHRCNCEPGNTGRYCEVMIDYCASSPCVHGDCVNDGRGGFTCEKCSGYTGSLCETEIDFCQPSPCTVGLGTCRPVVNGYICDCIDGVSGVNCEDDHRPPVGTFASWGAWSECSRHCDKGIQSRYRQCLRTPCLEVNYQVQLCQSTKCPERLLEKEHMVSVTTAKSLIEILQIEKRLRQHIIAGVNKYCSLFPNECCSFAPKVSSLRTFRQVLTTEHVSVVQGYPQKNSIRLNEIAFVIRAPFSIWYTACDLGQEYGKRRKYRQVYDSDGAPNSGQLPHFDVLNKEVYLDRQVLYYVIRERLAVINDEEDLCCLFLDTLPSVSYPVSSELNKAVYVLIAIGVVLLILLLILITLAVKRFKTNTVISAQPSLPLPLDPQQAKPAPGYYYGSGPNTQPTHRRGRFLPYSYLPGPITYYNANSYPLTSAEKTGASKK